MQNKFDFVQLLIYRRMPKQRRSPALPSEAGRKRIHLTEQYYFQSGEITSDFVLKRCHI